jgi:hypothetical protein
LSLAQLERLLRQLNVTSAASGASDSAPLVDDTIDRIRGKRATLPLQSHQQAMDCFAPTASVHSRVFIAGMYFIADGGIV